MSQHKNLLSDESSPYLLQHKDNPVWWHPWGDEAFARARAEDKPVFLSIGYSTCYWCHVMEKDSFETPEVAKILNERFVSIKVDREELPDVDQIYMDVVMGIHGHGGWPMSVFLTPDREPFWGGTFFYKDTFVGILKAMADVWGHDRRRVSTSSGELTRFLRARQPAPIEQPLDINMIGLGVQQLLKRYDPEFGGFGGAPKFPPTQSLGLLLRAHACRPNAAALEAVTKTLSAMARGGVFDQLGGGFHRYSVDAEWRIPHFEKMLYDNSLLVPLYLDGYLVTKSEIFKTVAERTLNYMVTEMEAPSGGFYSAEDAGKVGREGEYYCWTHHEISSALSPQAASKFCDLYSVKTEGNFEHGWNVLNVSNEEAWKGTLDPEMVAARDVLRAIRLKRTRPHRDEKILVGWNGLAITALCRGYQVLGSEVLREHALKAATFIENHLFVSGRLQRRYCAGKVGIDGKLEDYAYLIQAYLALFQATGDAHWLTRAGELQRQQDRYLWSGERRAYLSSSASDLLVPLCEWIDGASPSPNGVSFSNLLVLAEVTGDPAFAYRAQLLEQGVPGEAVALPIVYMSTLQGALMRMVGCSTCCVVAPRASPLPGPEIRALWSRFLPFSITVWGAEGAAKASILHDRGVQGGKSTLYVCRHGTCREPTVDVETAVRLCSEASIIPGAETEVT